MNNNLCNICLTKNNNLFKINQLDGDHVSSYSKLCELIPELNWHEYYTICTVCKSILKAAYDFKLKCIALDGERIKLNKLITEYSNITSQTLICYNCEATFICKEKLETHIISEHFSQNIKLIKSEKSSLTDNTRLKCRNCLKSFDLKQSLIIHEKKCLREQKCINCETIFTNENDVKEHKCTTSNCKRMYSCDICQNQFKYLSLLRKHCSQIHSLENKEIKPYTCEFCDKKFTTSTNLKQHVNYHQGLRQHICATCGKSFVTKRDLSGHELIHKNERSFKCESCEKAFKTYKTLATHKKVVHRDPSLWKYCCEYCQKRFPMKSNFELHIKRHEKNKQFSCHICGKSFVGKSEMQKHTRLHSNIREFKCEYCSKEYTNKYVFDVHLAKVHGIGNIKIPVREKKFACHICPSTFYDRTKLNRHLCSHSGVKPFHCNHCDKKFSDKSYLKQHLKTVHNILENSTEFFK